jgi:Holliday junction resolvase RusA-like endonuclease
MIARLWLPDAPLRSKQHSRGYGKGGHTFTTKDYKDARMILGQQAKIELNKQNWREPVACYCALRISYRGRYDTDNLGGYVQDALQGIAYVRDSQAILTTYRKRLNGPIGLYIIIHTLDGKKYKSRRIKIVANKIIAELAEILQGEVKPK